MDCLRRVDSDMSARRQVLPGLFYRLPPAQEKLDPSSLDRAALESALAAAPEESQADKLAAGHLRRPLAPHLP